ncbi:MAG: SURF1 family protein [Terracoccus sp.]
MSRGLITPRRVGFFLALLGVVAACVLLGLWQLGVAKDEGRREAVASAGSLPREPLSSVTRAHGPFEADLSNRPVSVTGTYAADRSVVVVDRRLGDRSGSWVVTPLETPGGTVAVLRGLVDGSPTQAPAPPSGAVTVLGTLGPSESPRAGDRLPGEQRRSVDLAALVNEWPGELYNVILLASDESVDGAPVDAAGLSRVPPPDSGTQLNLRNAAYAVQWWVFGIFAVVMWWKMSRAEPRSGQEPTAPAVPEEESARA